MLVIKEKAGQSFGVGDNVTVRILSVDGGWVKLGIEAPKETRVLRSNAKRRYPPIAGNHVEREE